MAMTRTRLGRARGHYCGEARIYGVGDVRRSRIGAAFATASLSVSDVARKRLLRFVASGRQGIDCRHSIAARGAASLGVGTVGFWRRCRCRSVTRDPRAGCSAVVGFPEGDSEASKDADVASDGWDLGDADNEDACDSGLFNGPGLYVVSTPIGNLGDITLRALEVLRRVDVIYAEDTRRLMMLLKRLEVPLNGRPIIACHEFNERQAARRVVDALRSSCSVALVSDAGTPVVSDPGFEVVRQVRQELGHDVPIHPVPGACAAVAALSVSGARAKRFLFAGFLPATKTKKTTHLLELLQQVAAGQPTTLVLYESPHRITDTLAELARLVEEDASSGKENLRVTVCRELTKRYETVLQGTAHEVLATVQSDPAQRKGEFVILVEGGRRAESSNLQATSATADAAKVLQLLSRELPPGKAAHLASRICGVPKKDLMKL